MDQQFFVNLAHRDSDISAFQKIKNSPDHKVLTSENTSQQNVKKNFYYHYAENKQFMLGEGSYGRIYICYYENQQTKKVFKLALKIISIPSTINQIRKIEQIVAFTRQEVKSLIKLRHNPNIIKIEDVIGDIENHKINLILQYCNNKDLDSYFKRLYEEKQIKKEDDVLRYFKQILNAFKDLYKLNIIHRDIKPENILVNNDVLKIADFGLSKQLFEKTEEFYQEHYGTFITASPQIRYKERYTNKCDIYSLGVTLYWMVFQKFPFQNEFSKEEFMKMSLSFEHQSEMKVSSQLIELIKSMLVYTEQGRIEWHELFSHPIFDRVNEVKQNLGDPRQTIGRDIYSQYSSMILDNAIPKEFYQYILSSNNSFDLNTFPSSNFEEDPIVKTFMPIFLQVLNQKFKLNFLKQLLRQVYEFKMSDKIKNKMQFAIMKDMVRFGLQKYIIHLMKKMKDELLGVKKCQIFDAKLLQPMLNMKEYNNFVKNYVLQVQNYEKSNKKPKMADEEKVVLKKRCKQYQVYKHFQDFLEKKILDQQQFLNSIKQCFIEIIYFVKDEVKFYAGKYKNLAQIQVKRFRELILIIHHFYMVILIKRIFPDKYTDKIDYDFEKFNQKERYTNNEAFLRLAEGINEILDKFEH